MKQTHTQPLHPVVDDVLRYVLAVGAVIVLVLPAARGFNQTVGWLPLWLIAMPLAALWARHGYRLWPRALRDEVEWKRPVSRRRRGPQARRRSRPALRGTTSQAA